MQRYNIFAGWAWFAFSGKMVHVGVNRDRLVAFAAKERAVIPEPRLRPGMRPDHLTIPLEPRERGPHAGKFWIHLTYSDAEHVPIAIIGPEELREMGGAMERLMLEFPPFLETRRRTHRVDAAWLSREGYSVMLFENEVLSSRFNAEFGRGKRRYVIPMDRLEELVFDIMTDGALFFEPDVLDDDALKSDQSLSAFAVHPMGSKGGKPSLTLTYVSQGEPGWYASPRDIIDNMSEEHFASLTRQMFGRWAWSLVKTLCTEFGVPIDIEPFEREFVGAEAPA